jgi:hypothetical protein
MAVAASGIASLIHQIAINTTMAAVAIAGLAKFEYNVNKPAVKIANIGPK